MKKAKRISRAKQYPLGYVESISDNYAAGRRCSLLHELQCVVTVDRTTEGSIHRLHIETKVHIQKRRRLDELTEEAVMNKSITELVTN